MRNAILIFALVVFMAPGVYGIVASDGAAPGRVVQAPAPQKPHWSKPVNGLVGRLVVRNPRTTAYESFQVSLELKSRGSVPVAVQIGNPLAFDAELIDAQGRVVLPALYARSFLVAPEWGVLPRGAYMGFDVTVANGVLDQFEGASLDIATRVWKLKPGTYQLRARFSSQYFVEIPDPAGAGEVWSGELELPPVKIEVLE